MPPSIIEDEAALFSFVKGYQEVGPFIFHFIILSLIRYCCERLHTRTRAHTHPHTHTHTHTHICRYICLSVTLRRLCLKALKVNYIY